MLAAGLFTVLAFVGNAYGGVLQGQESVRGQVIYNDANDELSAGDAQVTEYAWDYRNRLTTVTSLSAMGSVLWPLTDNLGTVRDLAQYNAGTDTTTIANKVYVNSISVASTEP